jgi:hypothetical protein
VVKDAIVVGGLLLSAALAALRHEGRIVDEPEHEPANE